jgi:hypothetical protein
MFETPKSLSELSDYEFQNLASYVVNEWGACGPDPGYSWEEFFQDEDLGQLPDWFNSWLAAFEVEGLLSLECDGSQHITLRLLKDVQKNEAAIFISTPGEAAERVGELSYPIDSIAPDMLWPNVEEFLDRNGILEMDFHVFNSELIPKGKLCAFLENEMLRLESGNKAISSVNDRLKEIYGN